MRKMQEAQGTSAENRGPEEPYLVVDWDLELVAPACSPGAETWNAKATVAADIGPLLGYLNAALPRARLSGAADVLVWQGQGRRYAFRAHEICAAPVRDIEEARTAIAEGARIVNDVWRRRGELQPDLTCKEPPGLLAIYRLLPRTNCGHCGRSTCMAFARDLREEAAEVAQCSALCEPAQAQQLAQLLELMGEAV